MGIWVPVLQTRGPKFKSLAPTLKAGMVACVHNTGISKGLF